ncbi:hypothetical protein L596_024082 [Steinernema carpocapsae]|uniref:EF-hand domain-containing protein n=2 Tax=Steinernema carpocapsae TaxID=34508 RepID=A0A4U5MGC8_STECR|nr:hypothetical protein L596_024082 [Steinernema carpocapsae]
MPRSSVTSRGVKRRFSQHVVMAHERPREGSVREPVSMSGQLQLKMPPMEPMQCDSLSECNSWRELFQNFDYDNDGFIPTNELKRAVRESSKTFGLERHEADYLLQNVDQNKDYLVDFSEFCFMMVKAKRMRMRHVLFRAAQLVVPKSQRTSKFSYLLQYRCCPPPLIMIMATIAQIAIYFFYVYHPQRGIAPDWNTVPTKSPLIYAPAATRHWWELWRFVTYMFVHIGYSHLITNCLVQLFLGVPLELVHQWRLGIVYFASGIFGCMLMAVTSPTTYVAGSSGGVYGLLAAHVSDLIINWSEMEFRWIRAGVLFVLISADTSLQVYQSLSKDGMKVAYLAHAGGAIAGFLLGIVVLRNLQLKSWERIVWWVALTVFLLLTLVLAFLLVVPL